MVLLGLWLRRGEEGFQQRVHQLRRARREGVEQVSPQGDARDLWAMAHGDLERVSAIPRDNEGADEKIPIGYQGGNLRSVHAEEIERARAEGKGYSGPVACAIAGISYRQLDYWARTNLITPSLSVATGSGSRRCYSDDDVRLLCIIRQVLDFGIQLQVVRELVSELGTNVPAIGSILIFSAEVDNRTRGGHAIVNFTGVTIISDTDDSHPLLEKVRESPCFCMVVR